MRRGRKSLLIEELDNEFYDPFTLGDTTSPRASETGQLLITDADGITSISAGRLVANGTTTVTGQGTIVGDGAGSAKLFTRADGLVFYVAQNITTTVSNSSVIAWDADGLATITNDYSINRPDTTTVRVLSYNSLATIEQFTVTAGVLYVFLILRATGAYMIIKDSVNPNYKVRWVYDDSSSDVYAKTQLRLAGAYNLTYPAMKVAQLPYPFNNSDADFRVFNVAGTLAQFNDQNAESGDFIMRFTVDVIPSTGSMQIRFRIQDTNNYWLMQLTSAGRLQLIEVVAGGTTEQAFMTGVIATDVITIIADGTTITYVKKTGSSYSSTAFTPATNFKNETATRTQIIQGGGEMSNWSCYPRVISGEALAVLEEVASEQ